MNKIFTLNYSPGISFVGKVNGRKLVFDISNDSSGYYAYKSVGLDTTKLEKLRWKPVVSLRIRNENKVKSFR
jgi:hypothetical protein